MARPLEFDLCVRDLEIVHESGGLEWAITTQFIGKLAGAIMTYKAMKRRR